MGNDELTAKGKVFDKVAELLHESFYKAKAYKEALRLLSSGAVDLEEWDDDFRLPKCLAVVIFEKLADDYRPSARDKKALKTIENLRKF